jgi:hypothetical protein
MTSSADKSVGDERGGEFKARFLLINAGGCGFWGARFGANLVPEATA